MNVVLLEVFGNPTLIIIVVAAVVLLFGGSRLQYVKQGQGPQLSHYRYALMLWFQVQFGMCYVM